MRVLTTNPLGESGVGLDDLGSLPDHLVETLRQDCDSPHRVGVDVIARDDGHAAEFDRHARYDRDDDVAALEDGLATTPGSKGETSGFAEVTEPAIGDHTGQVVVAQAGELRVPP
ncbi:hypothetical protein GCM10009610_63820 [Pseudonocardia xinjiangensis]